MAGRPPKPSKLHVLHGTRPDRKRENELYIPTAPIGEPPDYIARNPESLAEWERLTGDPIYSQVLAPIFRGTLIEYCVLYARMVEDARGGEQLMTSDRKQLGSLRMQLGITPASQSKVRGPKVEKPASKWASFV